MLTDLGSLRSRSQESCIKLGTFLRNGSIRQLTKDESLLSGQRVHQNPKIEKNAVLTAAVAQKETVEAVQTGHPVQENIQYPARSECRPTETPIHTTEPNIEKETDVLFIRNSHTTIQI